MDLNESYDVVIVGAGPVGLTLANLLGGYGVSTLVLERNPRLEGEPRAVTLDDESLRTMQAAGLLEAVVKDVVLGYGVQYFGWNGRPLAAIQPTRQEYGFPKRNAFRQPLLVKALYQGLARFPQVTVRFGCELTACAAPADGVRCEVRDLGGSDSGSAASQRAVKAAWLVGCDGARSAVREHCGIAMQGSTYAERWLIVDLAERTTPLRHTRTYCDPRRPAIRLPGPHGTLRYEFMLRPGDRDEVVLAESTFRAWIGERMPEDAGLPLVRSAIYGFHARVAARWQQGRVLLAGDAAHLTPPFAGQGLNSGIRDAANLAWKLAAVTRWGAPLALIDSYETERRPHATALIRMALRIGAFVQPKSVAGAVVAQTTLRAACLIPACRDYILQLRFKPKPRLRQGWFQAIPGQPGSELLPQPLVEHPVQGSIRLDQALGSGYAMLGWDTPTFRACAARWLPSQAPGRIVALVRAEDDFLGAGVDDPGIVRIRDAGGELARVLERGGAVAMLIRPDRYWYQLFSSAALQGSAAVDGSVADSGSSTPDSPAVSPPASALN